MEKFTIEVEKQKHLYHATSPEIRGLLVSASTLPALFAEIPVAMASLELARIGFETNQRISHQNMGLGTVTHIEAGGAISVAFDGGGRGFYDRRWFELHPGMIVKVPSLERSKL